MKRMKKTYLSLIVFLLVLSANLYSQEYSDSLKLGKEKPRDATILIKSQAPDTAVFVMKKSTSEALWKSIIPGWGQYYVESYWKVPIFFGTAVGLGVGIVYNNNYCIESKESLEDLVNPNEKVLINSSLNPIKKDLINIDHYSPSSNRISVYKQRKEYYRDTRDQLAFYLLATYVVSAIDAYVGAHLYDFNTENNLSLDINKSKNSDIVYIGLKYNVW